MAARQGVMAARWMLSLLLLLLALGAAVAAGQRVLLRDVRALTLRRGRLTASRRAAAVPQLQCAGSAAACAAAAPPVAQCYNRGADGRHVQWECKAELDSGYRFGDVEVSCEGYDYPDDPYILEGSCGLLFSLELTEEGERRARGSGGFGTSSLYPPGKDPLGSVPGPATLLVLLALAYGVYRLFLSEQQPPRSFGDGFSGASWQEQQAPPPPGFKATFTEPDAFGTRFSPGASSGPGFWTGLGAGGLLGYLAGSHRAQPWAPPSEPWAERRQPSGTAGTSGTRTASGFGGTRRR